MKVLVLSSHAFTLIPYRGDMISAMIMRGHEVIVAAPETEEEWSIKLKQLGVRYYQISVDKNGLNPLKDIKSIFSIGSLIKKERPDAVFLYQAKTIVYGSIAAKINGLQNIYALIAGLGSAYRNNGFKGRILKTALSLQYKISLRNCQSVFFQNNDDSSEFINAGLVKKENVKIINGSGVNLQKFKPKPLPHDDAFLFIGRLIRDKGVVEFMEAARRVKKTYPNARFQIVGFFDTNPTAIKEKDITPYILEGSVEYLGPTDDVRPYLENCSVFVLPSYHEGTPKSVLEAMAIGRPIITTDAPGCRETVIDGVNGFLIPIKDVDALADKMIWMINYRVQIERMAKESLKICYEKYDVNKVNTDILGTMCL